MDRIEYHMYFHNIYCLNNWVVVSNICYFHLENWGRFPFLTHIFQMGWNHHHISQQPDAWVMRRPWRLMRIPMQWRVPRTTWRLDEYPWGDGRVDRGGPNHGKFVAVPAVCSTVFVLAPFETYLRHLAWNNVDKAKMNEPTSPQSLLWTLERWKRPWLVGL